MVGRVGIGWTGFALLFCSPLIEHFPTLQTFQTFPTFQTLQTAQPQQPTFSSSSSELVVLPVVVTDDRGQLISELERGQFSVFDNGRKAVVELFTNEDTPVTVGVVIDTSSSMRAKLGEVIAATMRFASSSHPQDELFVIRFNDEARHALRDRQFLLASDTAALGTALSTLVPEGRTALYDALIAALDHLDRGTRARKVLVAISDGGDNASRATLDRVLTRARKSNAAIYTIGIFDKDDPDRNPGVLKSLAIATGGERFLPQSASPLVLACERIAREIRSGYTIGYTPPARDGAYHRVRVVVDSPAHKLRIRTRPGYFAGS